MAHIKRNNLGLPQSGRSSYHHLLLTNVFKSMILFITLGFIQSVTPHIAKVEPSFISRSETFKFIAGKTIQLPCDVANVDNFIVAWKRGIAIISAGSVKVTPDPRVRLTNNYGLEIHDAQPQDGGDYICQIATMEPREITHTVEILVPARILHITSGAHMQVKKGGSVRIECSASGNPTPNVTWTRKNNVLPNGEERLYSSVLSIENMDRHKGGIYICSADNAVGKPAQSQVVLHVLYPPEIQVESPIVYSGEGQEAMLVCIVHGESQPEVTWFKDTMQLDTTERHITETRGSRHTLIIRNVVTQDFGNYSCNAENPLGKSKKYLQLSGKPNTAIFRSAPISQYKDRYNISWTVDSHSPIEEYKLFFRRSTDEHELDNNNIEQHAHPQHSGHSYGGSNSIHAPYNNRGFNNLNHWTPRNDWRDVVLPAIPLSHLYTQSMSYMIRNLEPDQQYEAKVQARNRHGLSEVSEKFIFSTSSDDLTDIGSFLNNGLSDSEMRGMSVTYYSSASNLHHGISLITLTILTCLVKLL